MSEGQQGSELEHSGQTTMYRPAADGGLEPAAAEGGDYRETLVSRRWNAAPLRNPEAQKTDPRIAVLAILALGALTLILLVAGYGIGLWSLPA